MDDLKFKDVFREFLRLKKKEISRWWCRSGFDTIILATALFFLLIETFSIGKIIDSVFEIDFGALIWWLIQVFILMIFYVFIWFRSNWLQARSNVALSNRKNRPNA